MAEELSRMSNRLGVLGEEVQAGGEAIGLKVAFRIAFWPEDLKAARAGKLMRLLRSRKWAPRRPTSFRCRAGRDNVPGEATPPAAAVRVRRLADLPRSRLDWSNAGAGHVPVSSAASAALAARRTVNRIRHHARRRGSGRPASCGCLENRLNARTREPHCAPCALSPGCNGGRVWERAPNLRAVWCARGTKRQSAAVARHRPG